MVHKDLVIVVDKGKVTDVVCCANGTDSSHDLKEHEDYHILYLQEFGKKGKWIKPKIYKPEK